MTSRAIAVLVLLLGSMVLATSFAPAHAGVHTRFVQTTQPTDIRVWLEADQAYYGDAGYDCDVYPSFDNVVLSVRAARSCYAMVYVVDTAGYIHVVYPFSPRDNTYLRGGMVYRFNLGDFELGGALDRGVAYAFAVSSPFRFHYGEYGWGAFAGRYGFRIYGDPYVAARDFYIGLVPGFCSTRLIGVSHARFYVREYVRYPGYLSAGWHGSCGQRGYCRPNCDVYRLYSTHASDPYRALNPVREVRHTDRRTRIVDTNADGSTVRIKRTTVERRSTPVAYEGRTVRPMKQTASDTRTVRKSNVVSSKDSFVQGKRELSVMRRQMEKRSAQQAKRTISGTDVAVKNASKRVIGEKRVSKKTQGNAHATQTSSKASAKSSRKSSHGDTKPREKARK